MKKIIIASLSILLAFILTACGPDDVVTLTPPSFSHVLVEDREPRDENEMVPYIVNKQDTIKVEVFIDNPSDFQINTVTINQTTYRTNRFDEESTNQRIVLYLSVGQITGLTNYAVQRIEYIDENQSVEGIDVEQNNEYDVFVLKSLPTASIASSNLSSENLSFEINLIDIDDVIEPDSAVAVLRDGDEVIEEKPLVAGVNSLVFEDLLSNENYILDVHVSYDLEDGQGVTEDYFLIEDASFSTIEKASPTASIHSIETAEDAITFSVTFSDPQNVLVSSGLHAVLLRNGEVVDNLDLSLENLEDIIFDDLLNNNDYTIELRADYDLNDAEGLREDVLLATATAETLAREIPSLNASIISVSDSNLVLDIDASDLREGEIVDLSTLEATLYNNITNEVISTAVLLEGELIFETENLRSNTEIRIEIEADYDLQDGQGVQRDTIYLNTFNTNALSIPTANITDMMLSQNEVTFSTALNNPSNTAIEGSFVAHLYENDTFIKELVLPNQSGSYTFSDVSVIYEHNYTVKLYIDYDLRDGEGVISDNYLATYSKISATPKTPTFTIDEFVESDNTFTIDYILYDNDDTLVSLNLHIDDNVYTLDPSQNSFEIPSFNYNTSYEVTVYATYDLRDGSSEQTSLLYETTWQTRSLSTPSITLDLLNTTQETIEFDLSLDDIDEVATIESIELYDGETLIDTLSDLSLRRFEDLQSNTPYTISVTVSYDLLDGEGQQTITETLSATTLEFGAPTVSVDITDTSQESFDFDILLTDPDNVGAITAIELYDGDALVESLSDLSERTFTNLFSNYEYTLKVTVSYDLNDGTSLKTVEAFASTTTLEKETPTLDLSIDNVNQEAIDFLVTLTDSDSIGAITAIELYDGDILVSSLSDLSERTFTNLLSNKDYTIKVTVSYDLNDGEGTRTLEEEVSTTTLEKETPTLDLSLDNVDQEAIDFLVTLTDSDSIGAITAIELYDGENLVESLSDLSLRTFTDLLSNKAYTIKVTVSYDLNDGEGTRTLEEEINATTLEKETPTAVITPTLTPGKILFDITISDSDTVMLDGTINLFIYDDQDDLLETITVSKGTTEYVYFTFTQGASLHYELISDVDLNEDSINETVIESGSLTIDSYINISGSSTDDELELSIDLSAYDGIIDWDTLSIIARYEEFDEVIVSGHIASQSFKYNLENLLSDQEVEISVYAEYDLGSGSSSGVIYTYTIQTTEKTTPTGSISLIEFTPSTITASVSISDSDSVIIPNTTKVHLYYETSNGVMELQDTLDYIGDGDYVFDNLTVYNRKYYMVTLETDYYLEDGREPITNDDLDADYVKADIELLEPTATIDNVVHTVGSVTLDVTIDDLYETIIEGSAVLELLDDGTLISSQVISDFETTSYTFDSLMNNTTYTLRVVVDYDLDDAYPYTDQTLSSTTSIYDATPTLSIDTGSLDTVKGSVSVEVTVTDADSVIENSYAVLYLLGVEQERVALSSGNQTINFDNLNSNETYTISLIADVDYLEGSLREDELFDTFDFTSLDVRPNVTIDTITTDLKDFNFRLNVTDSESVITSTLYTIKILDESLTQIGEDIVTENLSQVYLYNLLTNHEYTIEIYAETNYSDGQGAIERLIHETTISTDSYIVPSVIIDNIDANEEDVSFDVTLNDPDALGNLDEINLYLDGTLIETIAPSDPYTFTNLLSNTTYEIEAIYSYDAEDGNGLVTESSLESFTTLAYTAQAITIDITDVDYEEATFELDNSDPDSRNTSLIIELYLDDDLIDTYTGSGPHNLTGLYSGTTYEIRVTYTYNLNDGFDPYEVVETEFFTTDAYIAPTGSLSDLTISGTDLSVDIDTLTNPDSIVTSLTLSIYEGDTLLESRTVTENTTETFTDIITTTGPYKVVLTATYDLNDQATYTDVVLDTKAFTFA